MNWLRTLWNWLIRKTSTTSQSAIAEEEKPTLVEAEEEKSVEEVFREVCTSLGIGSKNLDKVDAVELFSCWYEGPVNFESVKASLPEFLLNSNAYLRSEFKGLLS